MADLPQIPGTSGPPQIPGGAEYSAGSNRARVPSTPGTPETAAAERALRSTEPLQRKRRRRRSGFLKWHIGIALLIALIGIARNSPEVNVADRVKLPEIKVPDFDVPTGGDARSSGSSVQVPKATVYRASAGRVDDHPRTIIELGVRNDKIRFVAATRFPTECSDGTSSSGLVLYTDEGRATGGGSSLRFSTSDGEIRVTFRPDTSRGTMRYRRKGLEALCTGDVGFTTKRVDEPTLAQGLLDADRRATEALTGG